VFSIPQWDDQESLPTLKLSYVVKTKTKIITKDAMIKDNPNPHAHDLICISQITHIINTVNKMFERIISR